MPRDTLVYPPMPDQTVRDWHQRFDRTVGFPEVIDHGSQSGSHEIDFRDSIYHAVTASGNLTLTFVAPPNVVILHLKITAGSYTITLPTIKWPDGAAPTLSTSNYDWLHLLYDGSGYDGGALLNYS